MSTAAVAVVAVVTSLFLILCRRIIYLLAKQNICFMAIDMELHSLKMIGNIGINVICNSIFV